jgi:antitoxin (DNA-binding transcriptional repressor) of toxin-antitoxin stability system
MLDSRNEMNVGSMPTDTSSDALHRAQRVGCSGSRHCETSYPLSSMKREIGTAFVLQLTHMETIGIRELQQHASAALRRVARGEILGVTDRGRIVAILSSPSGTAGIAALTISGRVQPARLRIADLPPPVTTQRSTSDVLEELREDR